jgi:hypothetical protein
MPGHRFAGDVEGIKQWLEDGNDVNTPAPWLISRELLLHRAAKNGQLDCMKASVPSFGPDFLKVSMWSVDSVGPWAALH